MKGRQVALGHVSGREAAAMLVDGQLEDLIIDPAELTPFAPGAILRGRAPRALSLDGIDLRRPGGMAILRRWLTASPTGGEMTGEAGHG